MKPEERIVKARMKNSNNWIKGYYIYDSTNQKHFIYPLDNSAIKNELIEIDETILCYFIGLKDKNKIPIYSNDIVIIDNEPDSEYFIVEWNTDLARFVLNGDTYMVDFDNYNSTDCEVIGNKVGYPEYDFLNKHI